MSADAPAAVVAIAHAVYDTITSPPWLAAIGDDYARSLLLIIAICDNLHAQGIERVPSGPAVEQLLDKHVRNQQIIDEFNGRNYQELAQRYRISARTVRRIIDAARAASPK